MQETRVRLLGQEDPLEKKIATQSSILAWRIPWTEEPDRLQYIGSQVGHNFSTRERGGETMVPSPMVSCEQEFSYSAKSSLH